MSVWILNFIRGNIPFNPDIEILVAFVAQERETLIEEHGIVERATAAVGAKQPNKETNYHQIPAMLKSNLLVFSLAIAQGQAFISPSSNPKPTTTALGMSDSEKSFVDTIQTAFKIAQESNAAGNDFKQVVADVLAGDDFDRDAVSQTIEETIASAPCGKSSRTHNSRFTMPEIAKKQNQEAPWWSFGGIVLSSSFLVALRSIDARKKP